MEHESIRECVNVYCEWLSALTVPRTCVPKPIADDPNIYTQDMLRHLYNLFVPRQDAGSNSLNMSSVMPSSSSKNTGKHQNTAEPLIISFPANTCA